MNNHPRHDDSTSSPFIRTELPASPAARFLRKLVSSPVVVVPVGAGRALQTGKRLPLAAMVGGVILAVAVTVAPAPVFSMMMPGSTAARPMQTAAPEAPATPADQKTGGTYDATQLAELRGHLGEFIEIKGTPTGTGQNKTGQILYLNFSRARGAAVTVVFFLPKGNATPAGGAGTRPTSAEDLKQFVGKSIVVKGQLSDHMGDVQMVVPYLEQIKIQEQPKTP